ncbi:MAG TPA: adenosylmethionine--8-amino-7-oxononanoate transaminase [Anaerolineae bacterium]|nr:adenosylmethionine--8-amino-7-oxononanoate transaminase [Anaerolineae bacterium]
MNTSSSDAVNIRTKLEEEDKQYLWHPFTQQQDWEAEPQLIIERGEGNYLFDVEGNRYLDGISSLWVNVHGHVRPEINQAIIDQLQRVAHTTFLGLSHPPGITLARRLIEMAPGQLSRVFYSDTGAAAVEIALKMAYQYWQQCDSPQPQKTRFFSLRNDYHGDTVGAMSVGGIELFFEVYHPLFFPTYKAVYNLDEIEQVIADHADELAAVVMEPLVQGAAGMIVYPAGFTRKVREIARRHNVLFIVDEVATGFGRTGRMFACEHEDIDPDLMSLGKSITGGYLPLAATLATEEIYNAFLGEIDEFRTFYHGHTYTGNPVVCAAALANLDLFEQEQTVEQLQPKIAQLTQGLERLRELPIVGDIRQCGFMVGIELMQDPATHTPFPITTKAAVQVIKEARRRGVIIRPLSDVVVLMPPLAIAEDELAFLLDVVYASIEAVGQQLL